VKLKGSRQGSPLCTRCQSTANYEYFQREIHIKSAKSETLDNQNFNWFELGNFNENRKSFPLYN